MTHDEGVAIIAARTGMSIDEINDFLSCTKSQQQAIAQKYKDAAWVKDADTMAAVLKVLNILTTIAGAATGVGTAYTVIKNLV